MAEILRSWLCLNTRCRKQFDAWEANPSCVDCGCVRVQWVPGGGHVSGTAGAADAELRTLADNFGFTDMNSAERGRGAKKIAAQAPVPRGPAINFSPGFSTPIPHDNSAVCVPTTSGVDFKVKPGIGRALSPNGVFPGVSRGTAIEASHRPPR